jgi:predicted transposase YdaD
MFGLENFDFKQTAFYQEAFGEGRSEGRSEGRTEGEMMMLSLLLESRFGPLSEETKQRLNSADANTLLVWGKRVLDAKTLADIFLDG